MLYLYNASPVSDDQEVNVCLPVNPLETSSLSWPGVRSAFQPTIELCHR